MVERAHGTMSRYHHGPDENDQPGRGCRCAACTEENTRYHRIRRRQMAYGTWAPARDLEAARQHISALQRSGVMLVDIARLAGTSPGQLGRISRGETNRISRRMLAAILAATAPGRSVVSCVGVIRRARALARLGYSIAAQARMLGMITSSYRQACNGRTKRWSADKARAQAALYDRLAWAPLPQGDYAQRCRRRAAQLGWGSPAAWDDDTIDDPAAKPVGLRSPRQRTNRRSDSCINNTDVELICEVLGAAGWAGLNRAEQRAVVQRLQSWGWSRSRIGLHLHLSGAALAELLEPHHHKAAA